MSSSYLLVLWIAMKEPRRVLLLAWKLLVVYSIQRSYTWIHDCITGYSSYDLLWIRDQFCARWVPSIVLYAGDMAQDMPMWAAKDADDIFVTRVERRKHRGGPKDEFLVLYVKQHGYSRHTVIVMRRMTDVPFISKGVVEAWYMFTHRVAFGPRATRDMLWFSCDGRDDFIAYSSAWMQPSLAWDDDGYKLATLSVTGDHFSVSQLIALADAVHVCGQEKSIQWFAQTVYSIIEASCPSDATSEMKHRHYEVNCAEVEPACTDAIKLEYEKRWKAFEPRIRAKRLAKIQELESRVRKDKEAAMLRSRNTAHLGILHWISGVERTYRRNMKTLCRGLKDEEAWLALAEARSAGSLKIPRSFATRIRQWLGLEASTPP